MIKEFKLPDIGEGIHEGEIVRWLVKEGDSVKEDQPIAEVMTDKATVEITSPFTGRVAKLNAAEGATVLVGATIIEIDQGGAGAGNGQTAAPAAAAAPAPAAPTAPARPAPSAPAPAVATPVAVAAPAPIVHDGPILAAPATRKLARELGVDLRTVPGTGPRGRVQREDVQRATPGAAPAPRAATPTAAPAPAAAAAHRTPPPAPKAPPLPIGQPGTETRIPLRGLRKKIAEHMALSKRTAAHFTYVEEVEVTDLVKFRTQAKESAAARGVKLTYLPFILKAIVAGLRDFPMLNSSLDEERGEIVVRNTYNFGIAVDTEDGLVVPVVKAVDQRSILDLAREIDRVATAAREGKLALDDLRGGTFTITNAGNIGGLFATPVINFPEVAILGIHKIAKRPIVKNDQIVIGDVMLLSISIDHRVVDGADGARFMNRVVALLQDPRLLLLE
ncbi:MAG: 2-oxo acid dehydrogenase subunit E2 [Planctomycetes bacterium]|nr:2-oxo acid dehydrogenase subunit E2 [Planctomycetota bacterium]MCC7172494.1 2-oxo acid dehydrogenase subunit E2 [Planctomycetota bacterium]